MPQSYRLNGDMRKAFFTNEFAFLFKGNIHYGFQFAASPGARARPTDIVWEQFHKKLRNGSHDQHATQHVTDAQSSPYYMYT